jgi:hypothetical protein
MAAETFRRSSRQADSEPQTLKTLLLTTLEQHDGFCLDNESERSQLAAALATTLLSSDGDRVINRSLLPEDPQTTDSSVPAPPAE